MAIGASSPFDHNVFAAASGLSSSPWAKQPQTNHRYVHKAEETRVFNAPTAPTTATKSWRRVHATSNSVHVPIISCAGSSRNCDSGYIKVFVNPNEEKNAAYFDTYKATRMSTKGYTEFANNWGSKSGGGKLIPANGFKITGAVRFTGAGVRDWPGDISNTATGEYARKSSDGKEVTFNIIGSSSRVDVDVDIDHDAYGNEVKLSNGARAVWGKPNQVVQIKIWNIYYEEDTCPTGQFLVGRKCKSKGCKNSKYKEYTSLDVITDNSLCKNCKDTGGTGYTVDANCNKVAKAGYKIVGNVAKTVGCKDSLYNEYKANAQVSDSNLCLTCKTGYVMRNGKCKKEGCTDSNASNYDNNAEVDDGSCSCKSGFAKDSDSGKCVVSGCTDKGDTGYNSKAQVHDVSACTGTCKDGMETQNGRCVDPAKIGCMDVDADNYDSLAAQDDGSCTYSCSDSNRAVTEKGTCAEGCNEGYNLVDGICEEVELATPGDSIITTQGTTTTTATTKGPNTGLIVGGIAVVGLLGFMMTRGRKAAAEWQYY